jgi:hypothetical protein
MDWSLIIERNRGRLLAVLAPLFAVLGFDHRRRGEMPRLVQRSWLMLLRPAESAVRRLIIIAARGIVVKLRAGRAFPKGLGKKLGLGGKDAERILAFGLIDPLGRSATDGFEWAKEWEKHGGKVPVLPRISVPGLSDPVFPDPAPVPIPAKDDPVDTGALVRRIQSLKEALDNLPRHAKRLARWRAKGELARQSGAIKPGRLTPFRPGFAPGLRRTGQREIDDILRDCHHFAKEAWDKPDTS